MINWRYYLIGILLLVMTFGAFYIVHLQTEKIKADSAAEGAGIQNEVDGVTITAVDRVITKEHIVTQEVVNVIREIDALPSGEALVPPDVAAAWAAGIDGVRNTTSDVRREGAEKP